MGNIRKIILVSALLVLSASSFAQVGGEEYTVTLSNGTVIKGSIRKDEDTGVYVFTDKDGKISYYSEADVRGIEKSRVSVKTVKREKKSFVGDEKSHFGPYLLIEGALGMAVNDGLKIAGGLSALEAGVHLSSKMMIGMKFGLIASKSDYYYDGSKDYPYHYYSFIGAVDFRYSFNKSKWTPYIGAGLGVSGDYHGNIYNQKETFFNRFYGELSGGMRMRVKTSSYNRQSMWLGASLSALHGYATILFKVGYSF